MRAAYGHPRLRALLFGLAGYCGAILAGGSFCQGADRGFNPYPGAVATDKTHRSPQSLHRQNTSERAGQPQQVSRLASVPPTRSPHYTGGYVGGGRLLLFRKNLDGRLAETDGTWGYDYTLFNRRPGRIFLNWWHGRPVEPGAGTYDPDGVHVPDPVSRHFFQKLLTGGREHHEHRGTVGGTPESD